jgi:3-phenylpropionate/trans-cinnamate dioxygenase ferredoxin subunit
MADGSVNALCQVVCPVHRYRFDIRNGRNTSGEGYFLKTYRVETRDDGVYLGWEEKKSWFSF